MKRKKTISESMIPVMVFLTFIITLFSAIGALAAKIDSFTPAYNQENVSVLIAVSVTFSENMNADTIDENRFYVEVAVEEIGFPQNEQVSGNVIYDTGSRTATWTPTAGSLASGKQYFVTIEGGSSGVKDASGDEMEGFVGDFETWGFVTAEGTPTPPVVVSTIPLNNTNDAQLDTDVSATFSKTMNTSTFSTSTFSLKAGSTDINGDVSCTGATATFDLDPSADLSPSTEYTATITTGVKDSEGNPLQSDHTWKFTTGSGDTIPPTVISTMPPDGTKADVNISSIFAEFSKEMESSTISSATFKIYDSSDSEYVDGSVSYSSDNWTATFSPSETLNYDTVYTATITTKVEDSVGNPMENNHEWSFTTNAEPDTTPPEIESTNPDGEATDVATDITIEVVFSEDMDPDTIEENSFQLKVINTSENISGTVDYEIETQTATFKPTDPLLYGRTYVATITTNAKDLAENSLSEAYQFSFATPPDTVPPDISPTIPRTPNNEATDVTVDESGISITFSEEMDPDTINEDTFLLTTESGEEVPGTVTYDQETNTATFVPDTLPLEPNTDYTATITTDVTDLSGNHLEEPISWSFTTGSAPDIAAPSVLSTSPDSGAEAPNSTVAIIATFSEDMAPATINGTTFSLENGYKYGDGSIEGEVTYSNMTLTFTPKVTPLRAITSGAGNYTATITTGVTDLAGNPLAAIYEWIFTIGLDEDTTLPSVSQVTPSDGETAAPGSTKVTASFSEPMYPDTITSDTFFLTSKAGIIKIGGQVSYGGTTATFTPKENLSPDTEYTATVSATVSDLSGNMMQAQKTWSFTTSSISCGTGGDIDGDGSADLADVIIGLQILTEASLFPDACTEADVSGDGRIGTEEIVYLLDLNVK
ncbi:Ig-like domain-containing protein [Desulfococcaceae bacterium HSG8]|nr:Ig-like domain-containing protein [Desulfococcaceae bacterium HSG8]